MTWEQLIGKIREGLTESGARIRALATLLISSEGDSIILSKEEVDVAFTFLALAMSDLHSTVEHLTIGLDAVVEALREANKLQEVKGE